MTPTILHHVALSCQDPDATEHFYGQYFGFRRSRVIDLGTTQVVFLCAGAMHLELFQAEGDAPVPAPAADGPHYPGLRHLGFQVDDIDAKLAEMGNDARITLGPMEFNDFIPGWRTVWVTDPDGNIVEISQGYVDAST